MNVSTIARSVKEISFPLNLVVKRRSNQVPSSTLLTLLSTGLQRGSFRKSCVKFILQNGANDCSQILISDTRCCVDSHLCGQPCEFAGNQGCVDECVKVTQLSLPYDVASFFNLRQSFGHDGEHVCSAPVHMCGQVSLPCSMLFCGLKQNCDLSRAI